MSHVGAKYVSGTVPAATGRLALTREDGVAVAQQVLLVRGSLVDNGDGTFDITFPEEA